MKPVEEMTLEEIQAEREAIRAERRREAALKAEAEEQEAAETAQRIAAIEEDARALREEDTPPKPAPWPHEHLKFLGMDLEVRIPNQGALMAIAMIQQLDGMAETQMEIFNTFLANHLSPASLTEIIKEMTRPDTELTLQGLVQSLVKMRIDAE